jgi:hypothetical protein
MTIGDKSAQSYGWGTRLEASVPDGGQIVIPTPGIDQRYTDTEHADITAASTGRVFRVGQGIDAAFDMTEGAEAVTLTNHTGQTWPQGDQVYIFCPHVLAEGANEYDLKGQIWDLQQAVSALQGGGSGGDYLPLAGGKLTGPLTIENVSGTAFKVVPPGGLYYPSIYAYTNVATGGVEVKGCPDIAKSTAYFAVIGQTQTNPSWKIFMPNADPKSGVDTGSNFEIHAVSDVGLDMPAALKLDRATGRLTIKVPTDAVDDAAAAAAGVPVGGVYRNGSALMVRVA